MKLFERMNGMLRAEVEDDDVDVDAPAAIFAMVGEKEPIRGPSGGFTVWLDAGTFPQRGELVHGDSVGLPGVFVVEQRMWVEHNLIVIYLRDTAHKVVEP